MNCKTLVILVICITAVACIAVLIRTMKIKMILTPSNMCKIKSICVSSPSSTTQTQPAQETQPTEAFAYPNTFSKNIVPVMDCGSLLE